MLKTLNLHVILQIFEKEAVFLLSSSAKGVYIEELIRHFAAKQGFTTENCQSFTIRPPSLLNPVWSELEKAGLVEIIDGKVIYFLPLWTKYIFRNDIEQQNDFQRIKANFLENEQLYELSAMKYRIDRPKFESLIDLFLKEQSAYKKTHTSDTDIYKHFVFWLPHNINKLPKSNAPRILGE